MKKFTFKINEVAANQIGAMKTSSKSLMNGRVFKLFALMMLVVGFTTFKSCNKDEPATSVGTDVLEFIQSINAFTEAEEFTLRREEVSGSEREHTTTELINGVNTTTTWRCVTERFSASENPESFFMFNPLASVVWVGNLVQGNSIHTGVPTSIPIPTGRRQPGYITLAVVSGDGSGTENRFYRRVERMTMSQVTQAKNEILAGLEGHGHAFYNVDIDHIQSASHLSFRMRGGFSGGASRVSAALNVDWSQSLTRMLVQVHQQYFTMVFDDPAGINGVFTPEITVEDLAPYTGPGNPITYISSVTYGRVFYLLYESTASREELEAALRFRFLRTSGSVEVDHSETMNRTTVRAMQIGGDAAHGLDQLLSSDLTTVQNFLDGGANFSAQSPGAPISYTIRYLRDASLVRMNNTMEFEVEQCVAISSTRDMSHFNIDFHEYRVSATHSNNFRHCRHYLGIEVGIVDGRTGTRRILSRHPEHAERLFYGDARSATYAIDFNPRISVPKEDALFIRFNVRNWAQRQYRNDIGRNRTPEGASIYERIVIFDYDSASGSWIARDDNSVVHSNQIRFVTFNSPNFNTFVVSNHITYTINIDEDVE